MDFDPAKLKLFGMKKILIIEDDAIIAKIYRNQFEKAGFEVEVAADGQEGYYKVQEGHVDGVLLDLMLPQMNGVEILRKIRAQKRFEKLVIVVFTNSFVSDMFEDADAAGATRIFHKSNILPRDLIEVMAKELNVDRRKSVADPGGAEAPSGENASSPAKSATSYQAEMLETFLQKAPLVLNEVAGALKAFEAAGNDEERLTQLGELYRKLHSFSGVAGLAGLVQLGEICAATEALILEMHETSNAITDSARSSLAAAVEFLGDHFRQLASPSFKPAGRYEVLILDDELMSRRLLSFALQRAGIEPTTVEGATAALELNSKRKFDLIVVDESLPGHLGHEVIGKIRTEGLNRSTPCILVVRHSEFPPDSAKVPARTEVIARPYRSVELGVRALLALVGNRVTEDRPLKMAGGLK